MSQTGRKTQFLHRSTENWRQLVNQDCSGAFLKLRIRNQSKWKERDKIMSVSTLCPRTRSKRLPTDSFHLATFMLNSHYSSCSCLQIATRKRKEVGRMRCHCKTKSACRDNRASSGSVSYSRSYVAISPCLTLFERRNRTRLTFLLTRSHLSSRCDAGQASRFEETGESMPLGYVYRAWSQCTSPVEIPDRTSRGFHCDGVVLGY